MRIVKVKEARAIFERALELADSDEARAGFKAFLEGMEDFGSEDNMDLAEALAVFAEDMRDQCKE